MYDYTYIYFELRRYETVIVHLPDPLPAHLMAQWPYFVLYHYNTLYHCTLYIHMSLSLSLYIYIYVYTYTHTYIYHIHTYIVALQHIVCLWFVLYITVHCTPFGSVSIVLHRCVLSHAIHHFLRQPHYLNISRILVWVATRFDCTIPATHHSAPRFQDPPLRKHGCSTQISLSLSLALAYLRATQVRAYDDRA